MGRKEELWGDSQIPDAEIVVENFYKGNENILGEGSVLKYLPEHAIEIHKCKESIEYFLENYYKILIEGIGKGLMPLWPIQRESFKFLQDNNRVVLNASRRTGKTVSVCGFLLWKLLFSDGMQRIGMLGNNFDLAKSNLIKVKEAFEDLPFFLKPFVVKFNMETIILDNDCSVKITATQPAAFRGSDLTGLIIDEAAFVNIGKSEGLDADILQSVLPTLDSSGVNSFCILISTPYGKNNEFARRYFKAKDTPEETKFRHFEILWSHHPDRDDAWYQDKILELGSLESFYQEYGGSFDMGAKQIRLFKDDERSDLEEGVMEPIYSEDKELKQTDHTDPKEDRSFKVWELPDPNATYIAGVDTAEGVDGCSSVVQIFDITDLFDIRQVAEYANNLVIVEDFAGICRNIFNRYNQCYACVESNGRGGGELLALLRHTFKYPKLVRYHHNKATMAKMIENGQVGVDSHNNSKMYSIRNFRYFLNKRKAITIRSEDLMAEMDTFIRTATKGNNYKWGKDKGQVYDDRVDAMCWALFALHQDLVEDLFILDSPKFDDAHKALRIVNERIRGAIDPRIEHKTTPVNQDTYSPKMYFSGNGQSLNSNITTPPKHGGDQGDVSWLNF